MRGTRRNICLGILGLALVAAPALAATGGTTRKVAGVLDFQGVACPSKGECIAVGETPRGRMGPSTGVFAPITGGKPGSAVQVPGTDVLNRVTCPSANLCIAVGDDYTGTVQKAIFVEINHGRAGKVQDLGINGAASIGCGSSSSCWVPGDDFPPAGGKSTTMLVHLMDGKVKKVYTLTGSYTFSAGETGGPTPQCFSADACLLAGSSGFQQKTPTGLIFSMKNGVVKVEHRVTGMTAISGLDCTSSSSCTLVGYRSGKTTEQGEVATLTSGKLGKVRSVKVSLFPLACHTASACFAFGDTFSGRTAQSWLAPVDHGKPGTPKKIDTFISAATCHGKLCLGVGEVGSYPSEQGTVFSFTP